MHEYLRLDFAAYTRVKKGEWNNWHLRLAFEHENGDSWPDELCKLAHVVADLRVLVSYTSKSHDEIQSDLQTAVKKLKDRIERVPGNWLFAFGPRVRSVKRYPDRGLFHVFTFGDTTTDDAISVVPLHGAAALDTRPWIERSGGAAVFD